MKMWIINAVSPDKKNGQYMAVDAATERAALEAFHEETDFKMVDWTIEILPATPTNLETRA